MAFIVLYVLGVLVGFILLILPGIYLIIAWFLGFYLLIDKGMGPMQALGKSRELVHKLGFWKVFVIVFVLYLAGNVLFLIPFLGVIIYFFLLPFILMVYIAVYENAVFDSEEDLEDAMFAPSEEL